MTATDHDNDGHSNHGHKKMMATDVTMTATDYDNDGHRVINDDILLRSKPHIIWSATNEHDPKHTAENIQINYK